MDGFSEWARRHCTVFGLLDPRQVGMVASWQALFDAAGYTAAELNEATSWLATHAPPEFPSQHLGAVQQRVRSQRATEIKRREDDPDHGSCPLCAGGGLVVVPDVRGVVGGRWVGIKGGSRGATFPTHAALCKCSRGRFLNCTNGRGERLIDLATYEAVNPSWPAQMARRDKELAEEARLGAPDLGRAVDAVLKNAGGEDGPVF